MAMNYRVETWRKMVKEQVDNMLGWWISRQSLHWGCRICMCICVHTWIYFFFSFLQNIIFFC